MPKQLVFIQFLTAINKLSFYCMCNILISFILCFFRYKESYVKDFVIRTHIVTYLESKYNTSKSSCALLYYKYIYICSPSFVSPSNARILVMLKFCFLYRNTDHCETRAYTSTYIMQWSLSVSYISFLSIIW